MSHEHPRPSRSPAADHTHRQTLLLEVHEASQPPSEPGPCPPHRRPPAPDTAAPWQPGGHVRAILPRRRGAGAGAGARTSPSCEEASTGRVSRCVARSRASSSRGRAAARSAKPPVPASAPGGRPASSTAVQHRTAAPWARRTAGFSGASPVSMRCGAQAESAAGSWEATAAPPGLAVKRQGAAGSPGGGNGAGWRDVRGVPVGAGQGPAHRVKERVAASGSSRSSAATRRLAGSQRVQHGVRGDELARAAVRGRQAHTDRGDDHLVAGSRGQGASEQVKDVIGHRGARATYSGRHASARIGRSEPNRSQARSNSAWPAWVSSGAQLADRRAGQRPRSPQSAGRRKAAGGPAAEDDGRGGQD